MKFLVDVYVKLLFNTINKTPIAVWQIAKTCEDCNFSACFGARYRLAKNIANIF
nr:MAG TPA: hypothetical protein [Caudoviricetes sp.]